jgi:NAD(P)-dependent dehydrogenase (short-subunit alcohol dehydrogenase family)
LVIVDAVRYRPVIVLERHQMNSCSDLHDRVVVLGAAASTLGRQLALCIARAGSRLVLADDDVTGLIDTQALIGPEASVIAVRCDFNDPRDVEHLVQVTYGQFDACDVLVLMGLPEGPERSLDAIRKSLPVMVNKGRRTGVLQVWDDAWSSTSDGMSDGTGEASACIEAGAVLLRVDSVADGLSSTARAVLTAVCALLNRSASNLGDA